MIEVQGLIKTYGAKRAVDGVSFTVKRGDILGFLGPNGAGKSTTMKMITGFLRPDAGRATVDGVDPNQKNEVRALIKNMAVEKAVILSTHILEEVEAICTRVIIISRGKLVADETPAQLQARQPRARLDAIFRSLTASDV